MIPYAMTLPISSTTLDDALVSLAKYGRGGTTFDYH